MGRDKRFVQVGSETLIERSLTVLRGCFEQVCVVIAHDGEPLIAPVPVFRDLIPNCGSLGGLYTGLKHATTSFVFLAGCDMPFLHPQVIQRVVHRKAGVDIVMAAEENRVQPTHAVYSQRCTPVIEEMLKEGHLRIQDLMKKPQIQCCLISNDEFRDVDPLLRSFMNVNTPDELKRANELTSMIPIPDGSQKT